MTSPMTVAMRTPIESHPYQGIVDSYAGFGEPLDGLRRLLASMPC